MATKQTAPRSGAGGRQGRGDGERVLCASEQRLVHGRYWLRVFQDHPCEVTLRGLEQTVAEFDGTEGPEGRYIGKQARHFRRMFKERDGKAVVLGLRLGYTALIYGFDARQRPIVRGHRTRRGILVRCPFCATAEQHDYRRSADETPLACLRDGREYVVRLERVPALISVYIPTEGGAR